MNKLTKGERKIQKIIEEQLGIKNLDVMVAHIISAIALLRIYTKPRYTKYQINFKNVKINISEGSFPFYIVNEYEARRVKKAMHKSGDLSPKPKNQ